MEKISGVLRCVWLGFVNSLTEIGSISEGLATLLAGVLAVLAAGIAWLGIQHQISAQNKAEERRLLREKQNLQRVLTADLLNYSASILQAVSFWNQRARNTPNAHINPFPVFVRPRVYESVVANLGLLDEGWPAAAVITFYGNLYELNEIADEPAGGARTTNVDVAAFALRIRTMALSLSEALDGLNEDKKFPIPSTADLTAMVLPDGSSPASASGVPKNLQELLNQMGAIRQMH
jgi:hypothetical protein